MSPFTGVRISPLIKLLAHEAAAFELRSFSNYIQTILIKECIARDILDHPHLGEGFLSTADTPTYHEEDIEDLRQRIKAIFEIEGIIAKPRKVTAFRLKPEIKKLADEIATIENRSLANFVECLIVDDLRSRDVFTPSMLKIFREDLKRG